MARHRGNSRAILSDDVQWVICGLDRGAWVGAVGMSLPDLTREFVRASRNVKSEEELTALLQEVTTSLGFAAFALGHHIDPRRRPRDAISLTSYDESWVREATSHGFVEDDPILVASTRTAIGFRWSEVHSLIDLSARQIDIMTRGSSYGLNDGFTVPVHIPGEYWGTCSFGAEDLSNVDEDVFSAAQLVGSFAFEAARQLMKRRLAGETGGMPILTPRQIDCITLIAQGKTDWEAAQILGISQDTVHQHVETARRRYGVSKRTQLVVRALYDGQLSFSAIVN